MLGHLVTNFVLKFLCFSLFSAEFIIICFLNSFLRFPPTDLDSTVFNLLYFLD